MKIHGNNLTELGKGRQDIFLININWFEHFWWKGFDYSSNETEVQSPIYL